MNKELQILNVVGNCLQDYREFIEYYGKDSNYQKQKGYEKTYP